MWGCASVGDMLLRIGIIVASVCIAFLPAVLRWIRSTNFSLGTSPVAIVFTVLFFLNSIVASSFTMLIAYKAVPRCYKFYMLVSLQERERETLISR